MAIPVNIKDNPVELTLTVGKLLNVLNCVASEIDIIKSEHARQCFVYSTAELQELTALEIELRDILAKATNDKLVINPQYTGI
jgi:hypothetical protein